MALSNTTLPKAMEDLFNQKLDASKVLANLTTTQTGFALDASMGRELKAQIDTLNSKIPGSDNPQDVTQFRLYFDGYASYYNSDYSVILDIHAYNSGHSADGLKFTVYSGNIIQSGGRSIKDIVIAPPPGFRVSSTSGLTVQATKSDGTTTNVYFRILSDGTLYYHPNNSSITKLQLSGYFTCTPDYAPRRTEFGQNLNLPPRRYNTTEVYYSNCDVSEGIIRLISFQYIGDNVFVIGKFQSSYSGNFTNVMVWHNYDNGTTQFTLNEPLTKITKNSVIGFYILDGIAYVVHIHDEPVSFPDSITATISVTGSVAGSNSIFSSTPATLTFTRTADNGELPCYYLSVPNSIVLGTFYIAGSAGHELTSGYFETIKFHLNSDTFRIVDLTSYPEPIRIRLASPYGTVGMEDLSVSGNDVVLSLDSTRVASYVELEGSHSYWICLELC